MRIVREMKAQIILSAGALSFNLTHTHARRGLARPARASESGLRKLFILKER